MYQLLYHWDFTSSENIEDASGMSFLDKKNRLEAKVISRGASSPSNTVSIDNEGIFLHL